LKRLSKAPRKRGNRLNLPTNRPSKCHHPNLLRSKSQRKRKKTYEADESIIETAIAEPKAKKKILMDEDVVTSKRKPKRTSESEKTPIEEIVKTKKNTPPVVEEPISPKRKQKKSKSDDEMKSPKKLAKEVGGGSEKVQEPLEKEQAE
jgi:hypothetical protein